MVDLKLLNKWFLSLVAPETQNVANQMFADYEKDPTGFFNHHMIHWQSTFQKSNSEMASAVGMSFILGMCTAHMSTVPEFKEKLFEDWIKQHEKEQGKNVISFINKKIDRS